MEERKGRFWALQNRTEREEEEEEGEESAKAIGIAEAAVAAMAVVVVATDLRNAILFSMFLFLRFRASWYFVDSSNFSLNSQ